jgi:hypothetical protein
LPKLALQRVREHEGRGGVSTLSISVTRPGAASVILNHKAAPVGQDFFAGRHEGT